MHVACGVQHEATQSIAVQRKLALHAAVWLESPQHQLVEYLAAVPVVTYRHHLQHQAIHRDISCASSYLLQHHMRLIRCLCIVVTLPCSVTNTNAPNCDPQLTGSLTITATGLLTVNMGTTTTPAASSSSTALVKAADNSTQLVSSFNTVTPLIVDGVYSSSRPDTLLSSIVGFKRGNLDIPNVKWSNGTYTGSMTLSMFKGPVL